MQKLVSTLLFIALSGFCLHSHAQIVVANNANGNSLAQTLAGNGVTITNVILNCSTGASGTFIGTNSNVGMSSGIVLCSGLVDSIPGPNDLSGSGFDHQAPGDPDLDNISSSSTHDACVLEFDMQVLSDSVEFRYAFGSEEYLEFVNSGFNDVFGFFISGPGISGSQNIALIPGTATPVSIDNLNDLTYSQYYNDNGDGFSPPQNTNPTVIQYDGFTTVLTAKKKGLQPCQTYHLKLAVSDAGDGVLDSGVFLEANSLTSNAVTLDSVQTDVPNVSNAVEGCVRGKIRFLLEHPVGFASKVKFLIAGTATNGVDYQHIADSITIAAGDTVAALDIIANNDGLTEGSESVKIYLLTNCSNTPYDSVTLLILDTFAVTVSPDVTICAGDQVQLTATGGVNYSWTPAATLNQSNIFNPIATPSSTTTYICSTNVGACSSSDSVRVTVGAATFSVNAGSDIGLCNSTTAQLNANVTGSPIPGNPFVYNWSPSGAGLSSTTILNPTATPTGNSQQYVIAVSSGNCIARDTVNVTLGGLSITVSAINETCFGYHDGSVTVTVNGGAAPIIYNWSNGGTTNTITGLQGGTYSVTVSDNASCSSSVTTNVVGINAPFSVSAGPDILECVNSSVNLQAVVTGPPVNSNPFIYQWLPAGNISPVNSPTPVASPTTPTDYVVAVLSGACISYDTVHVVISHVTGTVSTTNETCYGYGDGSATVSVQTGMMPYQYLWSNGNASANANGLIGGNYTVTITDAAGCSGSANGTVQSTTPIFFSNPVVNNVKCFGGNDGSITITAAGGANGITYLWNNGQTTSTIQNIPAAVYTITATDANQCSADTSVDVVEPTKVTVAITGTDVNCPDGADGTATAVAAGGTPAYAYVWQNGISTATPTNMVAGNYRVTVTDINSCTAEGDITINEPQHISITAQSLAPSCPNSATGLINAAATGGTTPYNFELLYNGSSLGTNASGSFTNLNGGDYVIHLTDAHQCEDLANLTLLTPSPDEFIFTADSTSCYGNSYADGAVHVQVVSTFNQPYQFQIDGGAQQFSGDFYNTVAGTHTLTITNNGGCVSEHQIVVPEPAEGIISITPGDSTIQLGDNIQLNASFAPYSNSTIVSYNWGAAQGLSCVDCANPVATPYDNNNEYTLAVVYNNGCVAVTSVKVTVEGHPPVFTPNAFSPNGDGNNDVFMVYGEAIKKVDLKIFNRWGELIYESNNQFSGWDGTYKGQLQNPGVYTFIAGVTYLDGKKTQKNGSLTLVR